MFNVSQFRFHVSDLLLLLLLSTNIYAQNVLWTKIYNRNVNEYGYAIAADGTNFIVVGVYASDYGEWLGLKYSSAGDTIWTRRYTTGSSYDDEATGVAVDANHNVIIVGYSSRQDSIYLVLRKLNSSGALTWTKILKRGYQTIGEGVTTDNSGNIYVVGSIYDGVDNDLLLVKFNSSGDTVWSRTFSSVDDDIGTSIALDKSNNIIVTGSIGSIGANDVMTIKYSSAGTLIWTRYYDSGQDDVGNAIKVDTLNNIIVAGTCGAANNHNYLLIKYASNGTQSWLQQFNNAPDDITYGLAIDNNNNIFVTGTSGNSANYNYLTAKYTSAGDTIWSRRYDRGFDDEAMDVAIDASGNPVVTGYSFNNTDYDIVTIKYNSITGLQEEIGNNTISRDFTLISPYVIRKNLIFSLFINKSEWYDINLYDITGSKIQSIYSGNLRIGDYKFNNLIANSGICFLMVKPLNSTGNKAICKKLVSIK